MPTTETTTAYQLAYLAEVDAPDSDTSPGAKFLRQVESAYDEAKEYDAVDSDDLSELADSAVPVYTHEVWEVFTDLAAYKVDSSDLGVAEDMTDGAKLALYRVATTLLYALAEEDEDE